MSIGGGSIWDDWSHQIIEVQVCVAERNSS